jgi:hypothetical protein
VHHCNICLVITSRAPRCIHCKFLEHHCLAARQGAPVSGLQNASCAIELEVQHHLCWQRLGPVCHQKNCEEEVCTIFWYDFMAGARILPKNHPIDRKEKRASLLSSTISWQRGGGVKLGSAAAALGLAARLHSAASSGHGRASHHQCRAATACGRGFLSRFLHDLWYDLRYYKSYQKLYPKIPLTDWALRV